MENINKFLKKENKYKKKYKSWVIKQIYQNLKS